MCHCLEFRDEETEIYPSKDQAHTQLMKGQDGTAMARSSLLFGGNVGGAGLPVKAPAFLDLGKKGNEFWALSGDRQHP